VDPLHCMEVPRIEQLPRSENVYLVGPDRAGVIEVKREIEEKEERLLDPKPTAFPDSSPPRTQVGIRRPCSQGCLSIADLLQTRE
jgi:hypothetical protein